MPKELTNITAEEQAVLDDAGSGDNDLAVFLILKARAVKALQALGDLDGMAAAIKEALDDDDRLEELTDLLH